ncbi:hypothetical protein Taro_017600 [Colocasia esculenta]|uniref:Uncharacterized protein n=1 Tax=Colocasia esculenta TaxID=4460 RepID=A0A843URK5_COLES|nr:hypothetical protein [Colocasia esculenta]
MAPMLGSGFRLRSRQVGCRYTRQKATSNLSLSGSNRLVVVLPSAFYFQFLIVAEDGSCPMALLGCGSWGGSAPRALPSDEERDGSIRHVLNLEATPCVSLSGCDRIHVTFCLRVATGSWSPSGLGVVWLVSASLFRVRPCDAERDRSIRRVQIRSRHPSHRDLFATGWPPPSCSEGDAPVVAFWLLGLCSTWWCSGFSGCAVCAGVGRWPFWRLFPEGVLCVPVPAGLVLVTSQLCCFYGGCHASSLSPGARHLRTCPRDRLLPLPGTPNPKRLCQRVLLRAAGVLKSQTWSRRGKQWGQRREPFVELSYLVWVSEVVQALVRCGLASPSHCLTLRWFRSHVGRSGVGPQFGRTAVVVVVVA